VFRARYATFVHADSPPPIRTIRTHANRREMIASAAASTPSLSIAATSTSRSRSTDCSFSMA
jgi:hypothetical protein